MTRILVVDDEPAIARTLRINLASRGYDVQLAGDGRSALSACEEELPDLVVLDLGLPDIDGVQVLARLRERCAVPVVVLSARHDSDDKVEALDLGADDYVTKPFGMDEFMARLRAALRRGGADQTEALPPVETPDFVLDLRERRATLADGTRVNLTPTEWRLVGALAKRRGSLVPRAELLHEVWGPGYGGSQTTCASTPTSCAASSNRCRANRDTCSPSPVSDTGWWCEASSAGGGSGR